MLKRSTPWVSLGQRVSRRQPRLKRTVVPDAEHPWYDWATSICCRVPGLLTTFAAVSSGFADAVIDSTRETVAVARAELTIVSRGGPSRQ